jgi:hypothetical protein
VLYTITFDPVEGKVAFSSSAAIQVIAFSGLPQTMRLEVGLAGRGMTAYVDAAPHTSLQW